jgi:type I restriction enzyme S subunit
MPRADWNYMRQLPAVLPSPNVLIAFDEAVSPLIAAMLAKGKQSRTLAALRDTLLPKLISGELRIVDVEREVAAA